MICKRLLPLEELYVMTVDESLTCFGLGPQQEALPAIRKLLLCETAKEGNEQGTGDVELIRLCCVQLFGAGEADDALLIWSAKQSSFDLGCGIDIQLLCGAGLEPTKRLLKANRSPAAQAALRRIAECERAGDFNDFTPASYLQRYRAYYDVG